MSYHDGWESPEQLAMRQRARSLRKPPSIIGSEYSNNFRPNLPPEHHFTTKPRPFAVKYWAERGLPIPCKENNWNNP